MIRLPLLLAALVALAGCDALFGSKSDPTTEEIFREGRSLVWKSLRVTRVYDAANNALIYLAHAREVQQGSGKMSLSVIPLDTQQVVWSNGAPARPAAAQ